MEKKLKLKVWKLLDKHGKLRKEKWARYMDEALFKDFIELCRWYKER